MRLKPIAAAIGLISLNFQCSTPLPAADYYGDHITCTALNVYHESRGEPIKGQFAVALITKNRAKHNPENVCRVGFQSHQFSWTIKMRGIQDHKRFTDAMRIAALAWQSVDFTNGSTHYHADYVKPYWTKSMKKTMKIGKHIFYRERAK